MTYNYFRNGGAGYSGNLSLLVSARFTCNSSNNSDGAITVEGRLALCFRYRRALLDDVAAGEFVTAYAAALTTLSSGKEDR